MIKGRSDAIRTKLENHGILEDVKVRSAVSELGPTVVQPEWLDNLRHMLGATSDTPKKSHGFRNHFCIDIGNRDHATMQAMEAAGLVQAGRVINKGRGRYYHATVAGCKAIGLSKAAIKRAFED